MCQLPTRAKQGACTDWWLVVVVGGWLQEKDTASGKAQSKGKGPGTGDGEQEAETSGDSAGG